MSSTWVNQTPTGGKASLPTKKAGWFSKRFHWSDFAFAALLLAAAGYASQQYHSFMDIYEISILWSCVPVTAYMAYRWGSLKWLILSVAGLSLLSIAFYGGDLAAAEQRFFLKYLLSSQSAILWMGVMFVVATVSYWIGLVGRSPTASFVGTALTWGAVVIGFAGMFIRWYESYLIGPDVGHIPVSNLYEVFVLFSLITAIYYLFYEQVYKTRQLGAFVMLVVVAAVGFLAWYGVERQAYAIQPLVPALQSWWMKIHVPANFIGYGTFSIAAMVAFAYLLKVYAHAPSIKALIPTGILGVLMFLEPLVFRSGGVSIYWALYLGIGCVVVGAILLARKRIADALPSLEVLDDVMYKSIAVGFAFFTVATILGALWAAEAWGAYWQWDPKETWALVVWLNYAAWLHMRLVKGLRGVVASYWALVGLLVTGFAFLGVNMFLSGLHSYGEL
ncbi:cytochrome c-type biogenesis protein CcsB [Limnobacter thiooxidans]|uniref:C-type cytochrome biogenesis protein CcsB n=1 Tax=Limnobacter thiooxidans TaxID=131080 RepID=A0AA86J4T7_9BURK|nr:c-type cytochrome biogenesis protein CcsB [Limnobacter sp.]MCZ8015071.1 c-type cytochrome biogenesis protein CcsB [Limnobacter sp.]RZS40273.1 cytochrome c-type biogenesis protein CcsB [Limnobacter thiooxidans]BET27294.1 c-type cytochrome biogenesis protein CcsB [Limnobacter thiooxidans]